MGPCGTPIVDVTLHTVFFFSKMILTNLVERHGCHTVVIKITAGYIVYSQMPP